jgi:nitrite reductase/ring-hydroxylating ferredoxin subunit
VWRWSRRPSLDGEFLMGSDREHECEASCALYDALERRAFLRDAVLRSLAALGALSLGADTAAALPVHLARGVGNRADKTYPIPAADGVVIDKDESVIIARFQGRVFAFSLACPHQNTALRWDAGNNRYQCPKHRSRYRPDGSFIEGRATRGMDRFAVRQDGTNIMVNLDALYRQDEHAEQWAAAFISVSEK